MYTIAPKPAFVELINKKESSTKEPYAEIRVSKETKEKQEEIQGGMLLFIFFYCLDYII